MTVPSGDVIWGRRPFWSSTTVSASENFSVKRKSSVSVPQEVLLLRAKVWTCKATSDKIYFNLTNIKTQSEQSFQAELFIRFWSRCPIPNCSKEIGPHRISSDSYSGTVLIRTGWSEFRPRPLTFILSKIKNIRKWHQLLLGWTPQIEDLETTGPGQGWKVPKVLYMNLLNKLSKRYLFYSSSPFQPNAIRTSFKPPPGKLDWIRTQTLKVLHTIIRKNSGLLWN